MDFTPGADRSRVPMDFTGSEDQFDPMKQFMGESRQQVVALHGGIAAVAKVNTELTERVDRMETKIDSICVLMERLAERTCPDLAKGKSIEVDPSPNAQVSFPPSSSTQGDETVGGNQNVAAYATRESLLKKIELPTFDGMMPYSWICQVERYFHVARYTEA